MHPQTTLLGRLTRMLAQQPGLSLADRLCAAYAQLLGTDGAAITLGFSAADRHTLSATGERAATIENLQDVLREGPSLDAFRLARTVTMAAAGGGAWPLLLDELAQRGTVPRLDAVVMMPNATVLGVITSHTAAATDLAVTLEQAQFLANAVGVAILGDLSSEDFAEERWATRDKISQATGMVVAQLRVAPADALAVLRARSYAEEATLADVSSRVVRRRLRFDQGSGSE